MKLFICVQWVISFLLTNPWNLRQKLKLLVNQPQSHNLLEVLVVMFRSLPILGIFVCGDWGVFSYSHPIGLESFIEKTSHCTLKYLISLSNQLTTKPCMCGFTSDFLICLSLCQYYIFWLVQFNKSWNQIVQVPKFALPFNIVWLF